jgi:hypothetical protein
MSDDEEPAPMPAVTPLAGQVGEGAEAGGQVTGVRTPGWSQCPRGAFARIAANVWRIFMGQMIGAESLERIPIKARLA